MLNHFVQPATVSTGQAVEGLQPVRGYLPYNQLASLLPAFHLPEDEGKTEDEESGGQAGFHGAEKKNRPAEDIFQLTVDLGFQELIRLFLVPGHDKILSIRSRMRQERGVSELTFIIPGGVSSGSPEERRDELYEVQLQLFHTRKGLHCHIII